MLAILIQTIAHDTQRYPTVGDWQFTIDPSHRSLEVRVSELGNPNYEFLVAAHEMIEAWLCRQAGISQNDIDRFDIAWEQAALEDDPTTKLYDEPGDCPDAPYHIQHIQAGIIERQLALALNVDWNEYETILDRLYKGEQECHEDQGK